MKTIHANRGHESSYLGKKWSLEVKMEVERAMRYNTKAQSDLLFWGYGATNYTMSEDCENLPWLKLMRERKGPLPGDEFTGADHRMTSTPTTATPAPSKKGR